MSFTSKDYLPQCKVNVSQFPSGALLLCLVLFGILVKQDPRTFMSTLVGSQDGGVAALPPAIKDQCQIVGRQGDGRWKPLAGRLIQIASDHSEGNLMQFASQVYHMLPYVTMK